ncbi:MAG: arylsulfatase [Bryobacteraceae bacterium]|nr:arylsulfatase [Bryobacteraceae bacterium]
MQRRTFLAATGSAALASSATARKPNIVLILLDDAGYADLGCYGQKKILTPNIDRLASEGVRFTDCYAGGAVCAPSRSVLMTGLHTGHTPVRANAATVPLLPSDITVAEVLKKAGYATGAFGKWGLGDADTSGAATRKGFDEFFGYLHQTHAHDYFPEYLRDGEKKFPLQGNEHRGRKQYSADLIHSRALQFIRSSKDRPFFLYSCTTLPHGRFEPPGDEPYTDRDWPQPEKNYAAMLTRADRQVGQILKLLKELNLEKDTVVFLASDNGGTGGEGRDVRFFQSTGVFRAQKGTVYEGGIRVPMIVRWPGRVKAGTVNSSPWAFCDVLPTLAAIAGVQAPAPSDGMSVLPTILGESQQRSKGLYWEQHRYNRKAQRLEGLMQAARLGDWKGVRQAPGAPLEIYNLKTDAGEATDLSGKRPDLREKFEAFLMAEHSEPRLHNNGNWEYANEA